MSRLSNAVAAEVEDRKVRDYLLNHGNPQNKGKAALFEAFGFSRDTWTVLRDALLDHPVQNDVVDVTHSRHGTKYVVQCNMKSPDGRNPCLTTVWIIEGGHPPRLVTSYR